MTTVANKENLTFQTEVNQLLQLMIHSLYSNKEIFLRELVSNASDACDKLRFQALSNEALMEGDEALKVEVSFDAEARTVTISDNGIGMDRDEVVANIGTIARSGTSEFLKSMTGDETKDANMIGQFGVGFYSSFIVAERVEMITRKAGAAPNEGVHWESAGEGSYSIETVDKEGRGSDVILHLREDEDEFLNDYRVKSIINQYSDHIPVPVMMIKNDEEGKPTEEWEQANKASALWTRAKTEISDEEYGEFYKHIAHDFEEPLSWMHNRVEGRQEYTSLLYLPSRAPFDLFEAKQNNGIKLYVQRVFIMDDTEHLMPRYLRFVRGVIDSNDLPLNVSREILQGNRLIDGMRAASVKKVLGMLDKMSKNDEEKYAKFWAEFGQVLKEGTVEDPSNRDAILKLLRFTSSTKEDAVPSVSIEDYISRMKEGQDKIYYITADSYNAAKNSPHLEIFEKKGIEVLLMSERVDEWMMGQIAEFDGKSFQSVAKGELDLGDVASENDEDEPEQTEEIGQLIEKIKTSLGERVEDVRVSNRLTRSPSCIVLNEQEMAMYMQQLLKQAGQEVPTSKPVLEINTSHPIVQKLESGSDESNFDDWASLLLDQAVLAEGGTLEDPATFVGRMNDIMLALSK